MPRKGRKRQYRDSPAFPKSELSTVVEKLGNMGLVLLLFETPSDFAIFNIDGVQLFLPKAEENIWADYVRDYMAHNVVWLKEFKIFKNKSTAFNHTGINSELAQMIKKWHLPGQLIAVGKEEHKTIIEQKLKISCLHNAAVMEVMWGIKHLMKALLPQEECDLPMEEHLQMSYGLKTVLNRHGFFHFKPEKVNERVIDAACVLYDTDLCETKHSDFLLSVGMLLKEVSGIESKDWSLLKIATTVRVMCDPEDKYGHDDRQLMFSKEELFRLKADACLYDGKLLKRTCLSIYNEIMWARKVKADTKLLLNMLLYEDEYLSDPSLLEASTFSPGRVVH